MVPAAVAPRRSLARLLRQDGSLDIAWLSSSLWQQQHCMPIGEGDVQSWRIPSRQRRCGRLTYVRAQPRRGRSGRRLPRLPPADWHNALYHVRLVKEGSAVEAAATSVRLSLSVFRKCFAQPRASGPSSSRNERPVRRWRQRRRRRARETRPQKPARGRWLSPRPACPRSVLPLLLLLPSTSPNLPPPSAPLPDPPDPALAAPPPLSLFPSSLSPRHVLPPRLDGRSGVAPHALAQGLVRHDPAAQPCRSCRPGDPHLECPAFYSSPYRGPLGVRSCVRCLPFGGRWATGGRVWQEDGPRLTWPTFLRPKATHERIQVQKLLQKSQDGVRFALPATRR